MPKKSTVNKKKNVVGSDTAKPGKIKRKRKKRKRKSSDDGHSKSLVQQLNARYGKGKNKEDEISTALINPTTHPSSYVRIMARACETQLNRLTQPEPPANLVKTIWLCALCQNRSCFDALGDLYGPYYERLSENRQLPKFLVPFVKPESSSMSRQSSNVSINGPSSKKQKKSETSKADVDSHAQRDSLRGEGSVDLWVHGQCAFWSPELFLVGGVIPGLLNFLSQYWKQKCLVCSKIGASIVLKEGGFLHYPCAVEKGMFRISDEQTDANMSSAKKLRNVEQ